MNQQKNNSKNRPFGVINAIRYMMFTAIGLFTSGAGFGGCVEYSEKLDTVDCDESLFKNTARDLFNEMNTIIKQYAPRFA